MRKKHHSGPGPVPPGNRLQTGNSATSGDENQELDGVQKGGEVSSQQEEPQNRMGDCTGKGEHSIQEPGGKKDANH